LLAVEAHTTLTPKLYWAISDEARRQNLPLAGHIPPKVSAWDLAKDLEVVGEMKRAGVPILASPDGAYPQGGDALHSELELLVKAGLPRFKAIQAAFRDGAKVMGVSKSVGTIERGKTADLVLLDANPLENISNIRRINAVFLHGHLFSGDELSAVRGH